MIAGLRLGFAILIILLMTAILVPLQFVSRALKIRLAEKIPNWWHRSMLWLMGVRVNVHGSLANSQPLLLVSNHVSWVDILVLGSIRELCFIAKSEVGTWPIISRLAKMQGTVFVDRKRSRDAVNQADTIASRLLHGDVMVLFAEGTTGDGHKLHPFNSSLFGAAQYAIRQSSIDLVMVQPVAIAYTRLHGVPLGRRYQPQASWPGNVTLMPHLINFIKKSAFDVDVVLGEPMEFTATSNRKTMAKAANHQVSQMFGRAMKISF